MKENLSDPAMAKFSNSGVGPMMGQLRWFYSSKTQNGGN